MYIAQNAIKLNGIENLKIFCFITFIFSGRQCNVCCLIYLILMLVRHFISCTIKIVCVIYILVLGPTKSLSFVKIVKKRQHCKIHLEGNFQCSFSCPYMAICPCAISRPKKTLEIINKNCVAIQQIKSILFHFERIKNMRLVQWLSIHIEKFIQLTHTHIRSRPRENAEKNQLPKRKYWTNRISSSRCKGFFFSILPTFQAESVYFHFNGEKKMCIHKMRVWASRNSLEHTQKTSFR